MDDIVGLCKRRGFIFPSSEIYNGYAGFYDYGPLGSELKKNIKDAWWRHFVTRREDIVGLDSSIIHNPITWKSSGESQKHTHFPEGNDCQECTVVFLACRFALSLSLTLTCTHNTQHTTHAGHVDGFSDPMVDCKETKLRFRADQLFYSPVVLDGETLGYVCVQEANDADMIKAAKKQAKALLKSLDKKGAKYDAFSFQELVEASEEEMGMIPSPASGKPTLTMPRDFNLMFQTNVGAATDGSTVAYLRPETAQGIFINFRNALGTSRQKIPFGIAQIGKAFRNEITPRNFIFRSREFEQMEIEYFIPPGDEQVWKPFHEQWLADSNEFL